MNYSRRSIDNLKDVHPSLVTVMMEAIKKGVEPAKAMEDAKGNYGRFEDADSYIDPRQQ